MRKKIIKKPKKTIQFFDERSLGAIPRVFLTSIIVVIFFYVMPIFINYTNENFLNTKEFKNESKKILVYTLNSKNKIEENTEVLDERDLLTDILTLNDVENESVALSAPTIEQLFKDTNYELKDVRETKLVKPVLLTLLPDEIKMIEDTKKRKELFIQIVLPLILKENNNIRLDRKRLFTIINKSNNTDLEKKWLEKNLNNMVYQQKIFLYLKLEWMKYQYH